MSCIHASACVNSIGRPPEGFLDYGAGKFQQCGWMSPRISLGREISGEEKGGKDQGNKKCTLKNMVAAEDDGVESEERPDPEVSGEVLVDFEFRLEDPIKMLPADELFANGRLLPLHLAAFRHSVTAAPSSFEARSTEAPKCCPSTDPYLFSPKAPRCASHWKEILGLRKLYKNSSLKTAEDEKLAAAAAVALSSHKTSARSLKQFLHRSSKSSINTCTDSSLNLPLLKDSDHEFLTISSRLSLSSSNHDHNELHLHRFSLDSEKPCLISRKPHQTTRNAAKVGAAKTTIPQNRTTIRRNPESAAPIHSLAVDSPRMNPSGKIVFHGLERSSSSPSSFIGGPRYKHRGMERSYSANVRITPVLNVPVCSSLSKSGVFGLPLFQKKETGSGSIASRNRGVSVHNKNRS